MALGAFPDSHPQHVGMPGMHGDVSAVTALQKSDLIIALGARFDDRVTGRLDTFAPHAKIVHADIDPAEISKNRVADVPIVGDAREVLADLIVAVQADHEAGHKGDYTDWWKQLDSWRSTYPLGYDLPADGSLSPQQVIERIGQLAPEGTLFAAGVGQHQMWAAQFIKYEKPCTWFNSGGAGTMGYAVPGRHGRQGRHARRHRVGDRRRRLLPDDQPGTGHLRAEQHPDQGRHHQQRRPGHGPPVAEPLLRRAVLQHGAALRRRDRARLHPRRRLHPEPRHPGPGLRQALRGHGLRRACAASPRTSWTR